MIIGFCGLVGAGKTTAANMLMDAHPGCHRVRFAGPLKDMLRILGLTEAQVDGADKEKPCALLGGRTPRQAMQTLGTEWGRDLVSPTLWTDAWGKRVDAMREAGVRNIVADDLRFRNEARAIWQRGGLVVRIARPGAGSATGGGHASEGQDLPFDVEIFNDGELDRLRAQVETLAALRAPAGVFATSDAHG